MALSELRPGRDRDVAGRNGRDAPRTPWTRGRARLARLPWWASVILIFVASRLVTTPLLLLFARLQQANSWTGAHPDYSDFARIWDGNWYWVVATQGYPSVLPMTSDGHIDQNAWAFLPAYPFVTRMVSVATGLEFPDVAWAVSLVFGLAAALVAYRLWARHLPHGSALFAVALLLFAPLSPVLQVDYAESMFLFLLALALLLMEQRRYLWIAPVAVVLAFTRPGAVALALALAIHIVVRLVRRRHEPFSDGQLAAAIVVTVITGLAGIAWPVIAAVVTGDPSAYTDTELSWRAGYIGWTELVPFTSWMAGANWWFVGGLGIVILIAVVALWGLWLASPWMRHMGVEQRSWVLSYGLYLLAVFFPQSSTFRILMPMFPMLGSLAVPRSRVLRIALLIGCVGLQVVWLWMAWWIDGYDWTPP